MICEPPKAFSVRILSPAELAAPPDAIMHQPWTTRRPTPSKPTSASCPQVAHHHHRRPHHRAAQEEPLSQSRLGDARLRLRRLGLADRLVVSTRPLADICADMIDDIRIMPNCLRAHSGTTSFCRACCARSRASSWAGAQQHLGDLELIYPVVEALADGVDWIFMGMCPEPLQALRARVPRLRAGFPNLSPGSGPLDLDLAIAPSKSTPSARCKSKPGLLEYGAMGWPVICTDIYPYQNARSPARPTNPKSGSARSANSSPTLPRCSMPGACCRPVRDGYILENHATSWFAAYGP